MLGGWCGCGALPLAATLALAAETASLAVAQGAEVGADPIAHPIEQSDPATWPAPPEGYVKSFSLPSCARELGLVLGQRSIGPDCVEWSWTGEGLSGRIKISVRKTVEEARSALFSGTRRPQLHPKPYPTPATMIGDVSWGFDPATVHFPGQQRPAWADVTSYLCFCRRNVAVWVDLNRSAPDLGKTDPQKAEVELLRLCRTLVEAIDSQEIVPRSELVECPAAEIRGTRELKVGQEGALDVTVRHSRSTTLVSTGHVRPPERLTTDPGWEGRALEAGHVRIGLTSKQPGSAQIVVHVVDENGMTTTLTHEIQVKGFVNAQASARLGWLVPWVSVASMALGLVAIGVGCYVLWARRRARPAHGSTYPNREGS